MMSKIIKYGAVGEEGCEFMARTKKEVQEWIDKEIRGEGRSDSPVPEDYYYIHAYTKEDLAEMKEV